MLASLSATTSFATFLPPFGTPRAADFAVEVSPGEHVDFEVVDERPGLVLGRGAPPLRGRTFHIDAGPYDTPSDAADALLRAGSFAVYSETREEIVEQLGGEGGGGDDAAAAALAAAGYALDPASGYYFSSASGLYHDPKTSLYWQPGAEGRYYYWDAAAQTFAPYEWPAAAAAPAEEGA